MTGPVLICGTVALDTVRLPGRDVSERPGGSALYAAAAASLIGPAALVGVAGSDFPDEVVAALERRGVDCAGLVRASGPTMRWEARYEPDLERRITVRTDRGVADTTPPRVPPHLRAGPAVFLGSDDPERQALVLDQLDRPSLVGVDTMAHWIVERPDLVRAVARRSTVLLVNEEEVALLAGPGTIEEAGRRLLELGPARVVVKRGGRGAVAVGPGGSAAVPADPSVAPVDPTGAGDAFGGAFVACLARAGRTDDEAVRVALAYGCAAAGLALSTPGLDGLFRADGAHLQGAATRIASAAG